MQKERRSVESHHVDRDRTSWQIDSDVGPAVMEENRSAYPNSTYCF